VDGGTFRCTPNPCPWSIVTTYSFITIITHISICSLYIIGLILILYFKDPVFLYVIYVCSVLLQYIIPIYILYVPMGLRCNSILQAAVQRAYDTYTRALKYIIYIYTYICCSFRSTLEFHSTRLYMRLLGLVKINT